MSIVVHGEINMLIDEKHTRYFARLHENSSEAEYIVRINSTGCFVTDEDNDWEKDADYEDEALSNTHLYTELSYVKAKEYLKKWSREP